LAGVQDQLCASCHQAVVSDSTNTIVHPPFEEGTCSSCHAPHATKFKGLLTAAPAELCGECHSDVIAANAVSKHHPVEAGECSSCHKPHSGKIKNLLLDKEPRLCLGCHKDINEVVTKGVAHAPAKDECSGCHSSHSSGFVSLLTEGMPTQCLTCHDGDDPDFKSKHLGLAGSQIDCRKCHDPHGSKDERLILKNNHDPFSSGSCDACHTEVPQDGGKE